MQIAQIPFSLYVIFTTVHISCICLLCWIMFMWCPGLGQDSVDFCSSQEWARLGLRDDSASPALICWGQGRAPYWVWLVWGGSNHEFSRGCPGAVSKQHANTPTSFLYVLSLGFCCNCLLPYLLAVFNNLFLSQPKIFIFSASSSPPCSVSQGEGRRSEEVACGLE